MSNISFNIKSIEAFQRVSDEGLKLINENLEFRNYPIGTRISTKDILPNQILVILSGQVRLLENINTEVKTLQKLSSNDFIGLASFLRAESCESISSSSKTIAIAIPDYIILKLYKDEPTFKLWCDSNIQEVEKIALALNFYQRQSKELSGINEILNLLSNSLKVKSLDNGSELLIGADEVCIAGSGNIEGTKILDLLEDKQLINTRGPLPARVLYIPKNIFNKLSDIRPITPNKKELISLDPNIEIQKYEKPLGKSAEYIGQEDTHKQFKLVKATGEVRESLACIEMLSQGLSLPYRSDSIEKIIRDSLNRGKKLNLDLLGGITSMMGLYTTKGIVSTSLAKRFPSLALINWQGSFAVIKESNSKFLEIASPVDGIIRINSEQIKNHFKEDTIEILFAEKSDQTPNKKFGFEWLLPGIKRYKGVLLQVLLASFIVQLFGLANPLMIQVIIDKVISQRSLDTLQVLGIALVAVTILGGVISSLRTFLFNETTNRIDTRLGAEVIDHLLRLPLNYFDNRPVGELGSRIAELEKIRNFLTGQALTTILDGIFSLIYIVVMVLYSWLLTLIALGVIPIQILITILGTPLIRRQIRETANQNAKTQSHLVEVLTGIQTVKAQNVERVSRWKWQDLYGKYISKSFEKTITGTALGETSQVLQQLSQLLVLWVGASLVLSGKLTLGQLIAFRIISGYVTQPLLRLSTIWQNIQELRVSFERLGDIINTPQETSLQDKTNIPLPSVKGSVKFENLNFSFKKGQPEVLKNINLKINAGQFVGIVGQSGSGKSTLMKLLPRLYNPSSGRLLIDNYDISKVELYSLRKQIGIVPQEPLLFKGSVSDNITLTDPDATSDEIVRVSKIANAHDFIMELPSGYSTEIGERGAGLSGGQKQRIAIARTLLSNPKLLILDEATSALDYDSERKVCEGLRKTSGDATVFFITHRLSTVKNADVIVMLHQGIIDEIGTHNELMSNRGRYFALFQQQESM